MLRFRPNALWRAGWDYDGMGSIGRKRNRPRMWRDAVIQLENQLETGMSNDARPGPKQTWKRRCWTRRCTSLDNNILAAKAGPRCCHNNKTHKYKLRTRVRGVWKLGLAFRRIFRPRCVPELVYGAYCYRLNIQDDDCATIMMTTIMLIAIGTMTTLTKPKAIQYTSWRRHRQ